MKYSDENWTSSQGVDDSSIAEYVEQLKRMTPEEREERRAYMKRSGDAASEMYKSMERFDKVADGCLWLVIAGPIVFGLIAWLLN